MLCCWAVHHSVRSLRSAVYVAMNYRKCVWRHRGTCSTVSGRMSGLGVGSQLDIRTRVNWPNKIRVRCGDETYRFVIRRSCGELFGIGFHSLNFRTGTLPCDPLFASPCQNCPTSLYRCHRHNLYQGLMNLPYREDRSLHRHTD